LSEGRYGLYCPSHAAGEHANDKGYCNLKFAERLQSTRVGYFTIGPPPYS